MLRITLLTLVGLFMFSLPVFADSLQLQQMKKQIKDLEDGGGTVPPGLYDLIKMMEDMEKKDGNSGDRDNPYGKNLDEMSCTDDISGIWYANNRLSKLDLQKGGDAFLTNDDATGQYRTNAEFVWSTTPKTFTADYKSNNGFVRMIEVRTGKAPKGSYEKRQPNTDSVKCQFMGNMLDIGGVTYSR